MADEIKVKMSEFANATSVNDSDEIIILQNGENKKVKSPILEQKIIDKVVPKVSDEVKEIYTAPTPLYLADETPTKDGIYIPMEYGNYSNGLTYLEEDGDVEFILKSEVWTKRIIPFIANGEVKEGDNRAVSGGEVWDALKDIEDNNKVVDVSLQAGFYINQSGDRISSTNVWSASGFIDLETATSLEYEGSFGVSTTRLAFYDENELFLSAFPDSNRQIYKEIIDKPLNARYGRFSTRTSVGMTLKLLSLRINQDVIDAVQGFRMINTPVYENGLVKSADIVWLDGTNGTIVYDNYNSREFCFTSFLATYKDVTVEQPIVTFLANGNISNYPNLILK